MALCAATLGCLGGGILRPEIRSSGVLRVPTPFQRIFHRNSKIRVADVTDGNVNPSAWESAAARSWRSKAGRVVVPRNASGYNPGPIHRRRSTRR